MSPKGLDIASYALHGEKVGVGTLLATEEYKRLAAASEISFLNYTEFNKQTIVNVFGEEMAEEILKENGHDSAANVTLAMLKAHWKEICEEIEKLPEIALLRNVYLKFGVNSRLSDLGLDDAVSKKLLDYSPMVRNRLTLMRLRCAILEKPLN